MCKFPQLIAEYNNLPEATKYTGHCFRRSAASWAAENGGDIESIKRIGGWDSISTAEGYVDDTMLLKKRLATLIHPSTKEDEEDEDEPTTKKRKRCESPTSNPTTDSHQQTISTKSPITINNCSNIVVHIHQ